MEQVDTCLARGMEAERLAIYFEEIGAYQHKKNRELKGGGSGDSRRQERDEVVELDLWDDPDAMIESED